MSNLSFFEIGSNFKTIYPWWKGSASNWSTGSLSKLRKNYKSYKIITKETKTCWQKSPFYRGFISIQLKNCYSYLDCLYDWLMCIGVTIRTIFVTSVFSDYSYYSYLSIITSEWCFVKSEVDISSVWFCSLLQVLHKIN